MRCPRVHPSRPHSTLFSCGGTRAVARQASVPVYALTGLVDPIVPWFLVRPWLRKHCPTLRDYRIVWSADHNVLGTGAQDAAEEILRWMSAGQASTSV